MNVGSVLSFYHSLFCNYSPTKAFVMTFSDALAAELEGTGAIVNSLYHVMTELVQLQAHKFCI